MSGRQPQVRANLSRTAEAGWVLHRADVGEHRQHANSGHAHQVATGGIRLHQRPHRLIEGGNLLAELPLGGEHRLYDRCDIGPVGDRDLDAAVEPQAAHRPR